MNVKRLFVILAAFATFASSSSLLSGQPVVQQETSANGFKFELLSVAERGGSLEAVILVTAEEDNLWFRAYRYDNQYRNSRAVSEYGEVFIPSLVRVGVEETERRFAEMVLTEGIRTRLIMRFDVEGPVPESLQLVEIGAMHGDSEFFRVSFKGVQVGD